MRSRPRIARACLLALTGMLGVCARAGSLEAQRACRVTEVTIQPADAQIRANATITFIATAYDASGSPCARVPALTWTSSNPRVLLVDALGNAVGLAPGTATVTVTTGAAARRKSASVTASVIPAAAAAAAPGPPSPAPAPAPAPPPAPDLRPPPGPAAPACGRQPAGGSGPVESIHVQPLSVKLLRGGETRQLEYRSLRADGGDAACAPLRFLLDPTGARIASADSVGLVVSGNDTGHVTIRVQVASNPRIYRQVDVQVTGDSLRFVRDRISLAPGARDTLAIEAPAQEHRQMRDLASMFQFTSSDTTKVRVTPGGVIEAVAPGRAQIRAESPFYDLTQIVNVQAPGAATPEAGPELATLRFAPGSGRYLIEAQIHTSQEAAGQPRGEADLTERFYVSTALTEQSGNLKLAVTVDSVAVSGTPADLASALRDSAEALQDDSIGLLFTARGLPLTDTDTTVYAAVELHAWFINGFLPALPATAIAAGTTWSDTVTLSVTSEGITLRRIWRRQHRIAGWEDQGGVRVLRITTAEDFTGTGSGETEGQMVELSETGHSTVEHFLSASGVRLGSTQSDSSIVNQTLVSRGTTVGFHRTVRGVVTRLP